MNDTVSESPSDEIQINLRVPRYIKAAIERVAANSLRSRNAQIVSILIEWLQKHKETTP